MSTASMGARWVKCSGLLAFLVWSAGPAWAQAPAQSIANSVMVLGVGPNGNWGLQTSSRQSFTYDGSGNAFNIGNSGRLQVQVDGVTSHLYGSAQLTPTTALNRVNAGTAAERLVIGWTIPGTDITVTGRYGLVDIGHGQVDTAEISFQFTNTGTATRRLGFKNGIDVDVNGNDGAKIVSPLGPLSSETGFGATGLTTPPFYPKAIPDFLTVIERNTLADPGLSANLSFLGGSGRPDKVIAGSWSPMVLSGDFRYQPSGLGFGDSGFGIWWQDRNLAPGAQLTCTFYFGLGILGGSNGPLTVLVSGPSYVGSNAAADNFEPNPFQMTAYVQNTTASTITNVVMDLITPAGMTPAVLSTQVSASSTARLLPSATATRRTGPAPLFAKGGVAGPRPAVATARAPLLTSKRLVPKTAAVAAAIARTRPPTNAPTTFTVAVDLLPGQVLTVGFEVKADPAVWHAGGTGTIVVAVSGTGAPDNSASHNVTLARLVASLSARLDLKYGWNLLALPFQPYVTDPLAMFGPGTRTIRLVKDTSGVRPATPYLGILYNYANVTAMEAYVGYFVFWPTLAGTTLTVYGEAPVRAASVPADLGGFTLTPGWNMFGMDEDTPASAFQSLGVISLQRWDPTTQRYVPLAPADLLRRGVGYYAFVRTQTVIP